MDNVKDNRAVEYTWTKRQSRIRKMAKEYSETASGSDCYLDILTDHDWLQIECAANGGVSGSSDEWPDLVRAIEKVRNRKLMRQSSAWLRGFCEALILSR